MPSVKLEDDKEASLPLKKAKLKMKTKKLDQIEKPMSVCHKKEKLAPQE